MLGVQRPAAVDSQCHRLSRHNRLLLLPQLASPAKVFRVIERKTGEARYISLHMCTYVHLQMYMYICIMYICTYIIAWRNKQGATQEKREHSRTAFFFNLSYSDPVDTRVFCM